MRFSTEYFRSIDVEKRAMLGAAVSVEEHPHAANTTTLEVKDVHCKPNGWLSIANLSDLRGSSSFSWSAKVRRNALWQRMNCDLVPLFTVDEDAALLRTPS
jgi:plasmid stability protein